MCNTRLFIDEEGNQNFYLKLNKEQAMTLYTIMRYVGGDRITSTRKYADEIYDSIINECEEKNEPLYEFKASRESNIDFRNGFEKVV